MSVREFIDLPGDERMRIRAEFEHAGGYVSGYSGMYVVVCAPVINGSSAEGCQAMADIAEENGLELGPKPYDWATYFSLGSDKPPERLRHDGRYPGSKGFWCYMYFRPVANREDGHGLANPAGTRRSHTDLKPKEGNNHEDRKRNQWRGRQAARPREQGRDGRVR